MGPWVFRCHFKNHITKGEGSTKKSAKAEAAAKMIVYFASTFSEEPYLLGRDGQLVQIFLPDLAPKFLVDHRKSETLNYKPI